MKIAETMYEQSALPQLLDVQAQKVNDDRLYRALDRLLPHKRELEKHLKARLGELFDLKYDLLLYDVTSTYFEGQAEGNELAGIGEPPRGGHSATDRCLVLAHGQIRAGGADLVYRAP